LVRRTPFLPVCVIHERPYDFPRRSKKSGVFGVVTIPITVRSIYRDLSSDDPYRKMIDAENAIGLAVPPIAGLAAYTEFVAPPAAEAATKVFSSATAADMSAIAGGPVTWIW
jgi:hypothetical protein